MAKKKNRICKRHAQVRIAQNGPARQIGEHAKTFKHEDGGPGQPRVRMWSGLNEEKKSTKPEWVHEAVLSQS